MPICMSEGFLSVWCLLMQRVKNVGISCEEFGWEKVHSLWKLVGSNLVSLALPYHHGHWTLLGLTELREARKAAPV